MYVPTRLSSYVHSGIYSFAFHRRPPYDDFWASCPDHNSADRNLLNLKFPEISIFSNSFFDVLALYHSTAESLEVYILFLFYSEENLS